MTGRDPDKAQRYIAALDNARCHDRWDEVPELIRKVTKHAPQRSCYIETATAESRIVAHIKSRPATAGTSSSRATSSSSLSELIPSLLSTIEKADGTLEDVFQAQVCLGWVHWTLNEPGLAVARLPKDFGATVEGLSGDGQPLSPWTEVCLVKGCYMKGAGQSMLSNASDSLEIFGSIIPWLNSLNQTPISNPEFSHWSEKLLAKGALLASDEIRIEVALKLFRLWSAHPEVKQSVSSPISHVDGPAEPVSKSAVWKSYYELLTYILQNGTAYYPPTDGPERPQLASEIRRVESIYESNLLREVKFPMANATNSQVETWVEQVVRNWEVLCGPQWRDEDLGEGGQNAVGRNVLDILYRAATKTYHSHLVLRRLFHVHSALADFDLALKALDSYIEIVTSAKDRAEKSAEYGELEHDGILLQTLSEGIFMLCCFGSHDEAEKANSLTVLVRKYIEKHVADVPGSQANGQRTIPNGSHQVSPSTLAMAYRAIGVGLANWAHWTPVSESRDDIRAEAIDYLERSIAPELQDEFNYSSLYTLALLLAENRDLDGAIDYVKSALTWNSQSAATSQGDLSRERDLVPLWHLLALLLSAKHEFDIAERSCEAAFEQFPSAVTSFSQHGRRDARPLQNPKEQSNSTGLTHTLIEQLRGREKERIIETRMTQLAFVEVLEGPEAALNHSDQLLSLFATLFGNLDLEAIDSKNTKAEHLVPPRSSAGTMKSFRGSIFGRHKVSRVPDKVVSPASDFNANSPVSSGKEKGLDAVPDAPAIQVIDDDHTVPHERQQTTGRSDSVRKLQKRAGSIKKPDHPRVNDAHTNGDGANSTEPEAAATNGSPEKIPSPETVGVAVSEPTPPLPINQPQSAKQPLRPVAHNIKHTKQPPPAGHEKQPPEQDIRLPTSYSFDSPTGAITKLPIAQSQKHALGILIKTWLLIAGLYRRASLFEDANEACEEAYKQAARVEALVGSLESSARAFAARGWGAGKSSEELWADVHAERGFLAQAQSRSHEAIEHFEEALVHFPDHPKATVGLANLLLDIWEQNLPAQPSESTLDFDISTLSLLSGPAPSNAASKTNHPTPAAHSGNTEKTKPKKESTSPCEDDEPKFLNRLAARERAYGLLSALTKLGTSWDNSEAWYALSRAYEAGGQIEKLKEVLWWCIELEDRRPIRHWSNIGSNVYVL